MPALVSLSDSVTSSHRAAMSTRAIFFASVAAIYTLTILAATLTLDSYFAQTWDVLTFIQAAHRFFDGGNPFDLYAVSRAAQTWPYAYPPLHALVTAIFLWGGSLVPWVPDYVVARVPALIADIAVGVALYAVVARKSSDQALARIAMLVWLFNPVTFYNTAVQGHFESEWILFVVLAYYLHENSHGVILPTLALAVAVLLKQVAILFAIPLWIDFLLEPRLSPNQEFLQTDGHTARCFSRSPFLANAPPLPRLGVSLAFFAFVTLGVCLPYLLYSNDFLYMNLTYVENVPVQTQSWIVALLGLTRAAPKEMTSDFFFLRYNTVLTLLASLAISFLAVRRGSSVWLTAALGAIAFFLISRKVMGYYYLMLFPFLLAEFLPRRRFRLILGTSLLTAWLSLSPYYAPWVNPAHLWIYAALGAINSALFVWIFVRCVASPLIKPSPERQVNSVPSSFQGEGGITLFVILGLFASAALAAWLQPLAPDGGSPIRPPLIAPGAANTVLATFALMLAVITLGLGFLSRKLGIVPRVAGVGVLIFAPLFFVVYYLTKETTAVFEWLLQAMGV